jgi:adenylate cyclase
MPWDLLKLYASKPRLLRGFVLLKTDIGLIILLASRNRCILRIARGSNAARGEVNGSQFYDRHRVAVLPLVSLMSSRDDEYFVDGMTEELISTISRISGLHVISRTSVMQYKEKSKSMEHIGKELSVGSVIEGSVRKSSNRIRIAVQLIDVQTDEHLWSENYDRELEDVFAIQSDIATRVADSLRVQLLEGEKKQIERIPTTDTEAHSLYFKGRYFWRQRIDEGLSRAIECFKLAVERNSNYALGHSGLADCYMALAT